MTDKFFSLSKQHLAALQELRERFPHESVRSLIIPVLWMIQEEHGYIPAESITFVAELLPVPQIWVQEVVSWYTMFQLEKPAKHHIQVCRNLSCCLRGAEEVTAYLQQKLGIDVDETTADGMFKLSEVECLASCGTAPVAQIGKRYYENLNKNKIDQILQELRGDGV